MRPLNRAFGSKKKNGSNTTLAICKKR